MQLYGIRTHSHGQYLYRITKSVFLLARNLEIIVEHFIAVCNSVFEIAINLVFRSGHLEVMKS